MKEKNTPLQFSDISPLCLARALIRQFWMIIAAALIFAMAASLYVSWFHHPVYQASMTYAVTARRTSYTTSGNISSTREVASVMSELLQNDIIADSVRASSPELAGFNGTIKANTVENSNFIVVTIQASDPRTAFVALTSLRDIFPDLSDYISSRSIVQVIREPVVSSRPVNQTNVSRLMLQAALIGAVLMAAFICWENIERETIQTRSGARHMLDATIIGSVGHEGRALTLKNLLHPSKKEIQVFSPTTSFAYTEQINTICTQLEHESSAHGHKVFLITGVGENEGKSTLAANVAAALAMKHKNVALVDADLRNPSMHRFFDGKYDATLHLNKMLAEPFSRDNLLQCMVRHEQLGLYMLFGINPDKRSTELLTGQTMAMLTKQLRVFDYTIIDSPPMGMFPDAEAVAELVDASMLVVRQDYSSAGDINDAADVLRRSKSTFLGCILNDMAGRASYGYGYGKYGYGKYGYGQYGYGTEHKSSHKKHSS